MKECLFCLYPKKYRNQLKDLPLSKVGRILAIALGNIGAWYFLISTNKYIGQDKQIS